MKARKFLALLMALAMVFALALPVLADSTPTDDKIVAYTGSYSNDVAQAWVNARQTDASLDENYGKLSGQQFFIANFGESIGKNPTFIKFEASDPNGNSVSVTGYVGWYIDTTFQGYSIVGFMPILDSSYSNCSSVTTNQELTVSPYFVNEFQSLYIGFALSGEITSDTTVTITTYDNKDPIAQIESHSYTFSAGWSSSGNEEPSTPVAPTEMTLNKSEMTLTADTGYHSYTPTSDHPYLNTETLWATFTPSGATVGQLKWTSSNEEVATVVGVSTNDDPSVSDVPSALVNAIKPGKTTVTATLVSDSTITATCEVTVLGDVNTSGNITTIEIPGEDGATKYEIRDITNTEAIKTAIVTSTASIDTTTVTNNDSDSAASDYVNVSKVLANVLAANKESIDVSSLTNVNMTLSLSQTTESNLPGAITTAMTAANQTKSVAFEVHPVATVTTTTKTTGGESTTEYYTYDASNCLADNASFTFKLTGLKPNKTYTLYHYGSNGTLKKTFYGMTADANGEIELTLSSFSYIVGQENESYDCAGYLQETYANIRSSLLWNVYFHIDTSVIADPASTAKIVVSSDYDDEINEQEYALTYDSSRDAYYITVPIRPRLINQDVGFTLVSDGTTYSLKFGSSGETEYEAVPYAFNTYLYGVAADSTYTASVAALRSYRDTLLNIWPVS